MEITFKDYEVSDKNISMTIKHNEFNGIYTDDYTKVIDILKLKNNSIGKILINEKEINKQDINKYKKKINVVEDTLDRNYFQTKVYELIYYEIRRKGLKLNNPQKKITDSLRIVGLNIEVLLRNINTLSSSEKKLFQLALCLLSNPEVIIIEDPFKEFDKKETKRIFMLLQKIKDRYNKTIVFISNDTNMLYKYTNNLIILKNNKVVIEGDTYTIINRVDFLKRHSIEVPDIVKLTYLAKKKKKVKIDYHKDIRDIIKDIYKHV